MKLLKLLFDDHHGELALCTVQAAMQLEWQWWEPYAISVRLGSATGAVTLIGWVQGSYGRHYTLFYINVFRITLFRHYSEN